MAVNCTTEYDRPLVLATQSAFDDVFYKYTMSKTSYGYWAAGGGAKIQYKLVAKGLERDRNKIDKYSVLNALANVYSDKFALAMKPVDGRINSQEQQL